MRKFILVFVLLQYGMLWSQEQFALAPPYLEYPSSFFKDSMRVQMHFAMQGAEIWYTLNGTEPGIADQRYESPFVLTNEKTVVKAKAFAMGYLPSETVSASFYRSGLKLSSIFSPKPSPKYPGNGIYALINGLGGKRDFHDPSWLGFDAESLIFKVSAGVKKRIKSVIVEAMQDQAAWIFLPQEVVVFGVKSNGKWVQIGRQEIDASKQTKEKGPLVLEIPVTTKKAFLQYAVLVKPLQNIPDWHGGKGARAWVFLDEIGVYEF
jgi:hypothetical protein